MILNSIPLCFFSRLKGQTLLIEILLLFWVSLFDVIREESLILLHFLLPERRLIAFLSKFT